MAESASRPGLNIGDRQILDALKLSTDEEIIAKLIELRDSGTSLDITELPTVSVESIFSQLTTTNRLAVIEFLLDANPLTVINKSIFSFVLNYVPPEFPSYAPLLHRAIRLKRKSLVQKLIAYGADVNKVQRSAGQSIKPLDVSARTTPELYHLLKEAGATSENPEYFAKEATYEIFKIHFADVEIAKQLLYACLSNSNQILEPLLREKGFVLEGPLLFRLLSYSARNPSPPVTSFLWDIYKSKYVFDAVFPYRDPMRVMFSQRGLTCVSDAIFTVLFESPELAPLWSGLDWRGLSASANMATSRYAGMFQAAKVRHERLAGRTFTRGPLRRQESIQNTLWEGMHVPIACPSGGILFKDSVTFLRDIFENNKLLIPSFAYRPYEIIESTPTKSTDLSISPSRISAIFVSTLDINKKQPHEHIFGFFKNATNSWVLVDNEVGFLHTIQDTDWMNREFLPRLITTVKDPDLLDLEKKVFFYLRNLLEFDLASQMIAIGSKSYPNIDPGNVFLNQDMLYVPTKAIFIVRNVYNPYAAGAAGAAGAAAGPYGPMFPTPSITGPYEYMLPMKEGGRRRKTRRLRKQRRRKTFSRH